MRYLLDTNVISNVTKPVPSNSLVAWMSRQAGEDLFIASMTVAEIRRGLLEKPPGTRRDQLEAWFGGAEGSQALFAGGWPRGQRGAGRGARSIRSLPRWLKPTAASW